MPDSKSILIVGAGGFIGGFIARRALQMGYDTYVGVRQSTSRHHLTDPRLHFVTFDYDNPRQMADAISQALPADGRWTHIIWNLGATKCARFADFDRINYGYIRSFITLITELDVIPRRLLFMSSLSALGPGDETYYAPLSENTVPNPNTRYGLSKIKAETMLGANPQIPWIIFRPTGVYGPHEKDYLMMIQSIHHHFDFGVGYRRQMLTFIYVEDLVDAMFQALNATDQVIHRKYIISEPRAYSQNEFRKIVARRLGTRFVIPIKLPLFTARIASAVAEKIAAARGKASTLNRDKYKIMAQRNWTCDITPAQRDFGFSPRFPLEKGIDATVDAYLSHKKNRHP